MFILVNFVGRMEQHMRNNNQNRNNKTMRRLLSFFALAGCFLLFCACSSDEDEVTVTKSKMYGTWTLVNDPDPSIVTKLKFSEDGFINYSSAYTAVNPTIPAGISSYQRDVVTDPSLVPPYIPGTVQYEREQGYFVVSGDQLTLWPQVRRTSTDGSSWTEAAVANLPVMQTYSFTINSQNNILRLTMGNATTQTYYR